MTPSVLILNYEYPPLGGGAANALYYIMREFTALGEIKVDLVTSSADGQAEIKKIGENIFIHRLAIKKASRHYWTEKEIFSYSFKAMGYARRLVKTNDYNLCHAFFAIPCGVIAYRLRQQLPYIVSLRGSDVPGFNERLNWMNSLLRPIFKRVLKKASAVQANSEGLRQLAHQTSPVAKIDIIHNGIDCRQFSPSARRCLSGAKRLITVSRLIGRKGIADLISALPSIQTELGGVELVLVGEGNLKEGLRELAEAKGVADNIQWLGYVDHDRLPDLYRQADLFVLPSHYEGMSNALLEAMASGLPVVVTATGGTDELVEGNGLIVEAGNVRALAEAVKIVLSDEYAWSAYSKKSRQIAINFSWENVAGEYLRTYKKATSGHRKLVGVNP